MVVGGHQSDERVVHDLVGELRVSGRVGDVRKVPVGNDLTRVDGSCKYRFPANSELGK